MTISPPRAWAEVDFSALRHNLKLARDRSGTAIMAAVKADAYGHGLIQIAEVLDQEKLPFLGVANVAEARQLDEAGIASRPCILGATLPCEREEIVARRLIPAICSFDEIAHFDQLGRDHPVETHLALDTGMGRGGFQPEQLGEALEKIKNAKGLKLNGVGSHLPVADEETEFTRGQFELFDSLVESIPGRDENFQVHLSNSAGLLGFRSRTVNLSRPGLMLYGISPLPGEQSHLRPVMTLKTRISVITHLPKGHGVSYGRTILTRDSRTAVLGIGYGDGYPWALSGQESSVLIRGMRCPLLGRVTMDQVIVDVTDLPDCEVGDEATLFGADLLVSEVAQKAGTISWEILTRLTPRVTRQYH